MHPDQRKDLEQRMELGNKLSSVMAHPEWNMVHILIEEEIRMHNNKSRSVAFRQDPTQYANIVRAMDNADAVEAILKKFDNVIRLGREAREKLEKADGQPGTGQ